MLVYSATFPKRIRNVSLSFWAIQKSYAVYKCCCIAEEWEKSQFGSNFQIMIQCCQTASGQWAWLALWLQHQLVASKPSCVHTVESQASAVPSPLILVCSMTLKKGENVSCA
jgi:hypothetical protein